jgi:hypothetical protein
MGKMSGWRIVAGGVLAGLILFFEQGFVHMVLLKDAAAELVKLGMLRPDFDTGPAVKIQCILDLLTGVLVAWFYAAVRPRLGAGLATAILAGFAVWLLLFLQSSVPQALWTPKLAPGAELAALGDLFGLVIGSAVAGWVYSESSDGGGRSKK